MHIAHNFEVENIIFWRRGVLVSSFGIVSNSIRMLKIFQLIEAVAGTDTTILLTGETGTGKELIAKAIHALSKRSDKSFIAINCGAVPAELIEREFFGHEKGAFTGAQQRMIGKFEYADKGTVFLDEIATLPLHQQVKLLRVLQEKTFERIGSNFSIKIDVRFIAAANINLSEEIQKGTFREDLYYRLNVVPIEVPALRERKEDIPLLLDHYLQKYSKIYNKQINVISNEAIKVLMNHSWPGNVRELQNLSELLVVLSKDGTRIDITDLPDCFFKPESIELDYENALKSFEREYIAKMLHKTNGNINEAARKMNVHRNTLSKKIKFLKLCSG